MNANIESQRLQLELAKAQNDAVFQSDRIGQIFGFIASAVAISGAIYLGINDHVVVASALAALPLAGIIRAFRDKSHGEKNPS